MTAGIVPQLVPEASLEGLAVGDLRLGLDPGAPWRRLPSGDLGVPRAEIAVDRERHLGSPAERRMKSRPETLQKRQLRPIPNRISGRVGADRQVEPDDGAIGRYERKVRILDLAPLELPDSCMRRADSAPDLRLAQTGSDPGEAAIGCHATQGITATPSSPIRDALSNSHCARSWHTALHSRSTRRVRTPGVPIDERDHTGLPNCPPQPLVGTLGDRFDDWGGLKPLHRAPRSLMGTLGVQAGQAAGRGGQ